MLPVGLIIFIIILKDNIDLGKFEIFEGLRACYEVAIATT